MSIIRPAVQRAAHCSGVQAAWPTTQRSARRLFSSSSARAVAYGFIGLGRMGYPMAKNLRAKIQKSDTLIVFDVNKQATERLRTEVGENNLSVAQDVQQVAAESETIITSLPEPSHVKDVFSAILGAAPSFPRMAQSRMYIDCSTIDPITSREVAAQVVSASGTTAGTPDAFIDAPMSGGVVGATAGTLTFMLGCPKSHLARATAVLEFMGRRVLHLGDQGAGLCGKLANNYALALNNIATAEAMSMGIQWGLDAKVLAGMINSSTGKSWPSEINNPVPGVVDTAPASRGYEGGFGISLMSKDLRLALAACQEYGVKVGLGDTAAQIYKEAEQDERCKGKDFSSVYRWLDGPEK